MDEDNTLTHEAFQFIFTCGQINNERIPSIFKHVSLTTIRKGSELICFVVLVFFFFFFFLLFLRERKKGSDLFRARIKEKCFYNYYFENAYIPLIL